MKIHGNIVCIDSTDLCNVRTSTFQSGTVSCVDSTDLFQSYGYIIGQTLTLSGTPSFYQGQLLDTFQGLNLTLFSPQLIGWTTDTSGVYVDGTYTQPRPFNPISINYGIYYSSDGTWQLEGYKYRTPLNPQVGQFWANMEAPVTVGAHKIQWLYKKNPTSYTTAVNQNFTVDFWGNQTNVPSIAPYPTPYALTQPPSVVLTPGQSTATFTVVIYGTMPVPLTYQWRHNGINISDGLHYSGTSTNTLTILNITSSELNSYDCVISNIMASSISWLIMDP